jgi:hypothetical protein
MTDDARGEFADDEVLTDEGTRDGTHTEAGEPPQYGVGPFSIREVALGGVWLVAFILSFVPVFGSSSLWGAGLTWILTIGVPTAAMFLLVLRRLSPDGIRRVGSLGIDQFASVAFSVSAVFWLTMAWQQVSIAVATGMTGRGSWVIWVEFILMLAGVVLTVFAPVLPVLREDFRFRPESLAHPNARRLRPVTARPARPKPQPQAAASPATGAAHGTDGYGASPDAVHRAADAPHAPSDAGHPAAVAAYPASDATTSRESADTTETAAFEPFVFDVDPETGTRTAPDAAGPVAESATLDEPTGTRPGAPQAFWALAPEEREVLDAAGTPIFSVGPTAWALVIEDRGEVFVVRHEDGRIGYLHDVTGMTRG